jgi:hypothetical protein
MRTPCLALGAREGVSARKKDEEPPPSRNGAREGEERVRNPLRLTFGVREGVVAIEDN